MKLRKVEGTDHVWLFELHNDPEVLRNLTHPSPIRFIEHLQWWNSIRNDPKEQRLIFTVDDVRVGFTKFYAIDQINDSCVLGADIHKTNRGKGYAKHMWALMLEQCFERWHMHRVSLTTADFNLIGHHVYKSLGFKEEGRMLQSLKRDGTYHDQIMMYMLRNDWSKDKPI